MRTNQPIAEVVYERANVKWGEKASSMVLELLLSN